MYGQNSTRASAKETLIIDSSDVLSEILGIDFCITNKDTKVSYNKVLAKADIEMRILYLTDDGRIKTLEETIPVIGFIDLVGVSEDSICDVKYKVKNVIIKPNSAEDHSIYVEIELEIFCNSYEEKEVSIIQDMYSPSVNLGFKENKVSTMVDLKNTTDTVSIRDKVRLEDAEHTKICDVQVTPIVSNMDISRDRVRVDGDLSLNFILTNDMGDSIVTLNRQVPFNFTQDIQGLTEDSKLDMEIVPVFREFLTDDMEVAVKVDLGVNTNSYNLESVNVIDEIEELADECANPYSMVIYFVKPGDTIWKIAKRYRSTVEDIARVNDLEDPDKIMPGMQLFIPRCSACKVSA